MSLSLIDKAYLHAAIETAGAGLFSTSPNPRVGCLLVKDGEILGRGAHLRAGEAHAEILAIAEAGEEARGSTAYVSLEPCCVQGRTGPCTEALIAAGVARVVSALVDPDPRAKGRGLKKLKSAGISIMNARLPGAIKMNQGYVKRHQQGLPWVRLKMAMSIDGRTAMNDGMSRWISGEASRRDVQYWRARSCAVVTGAGTVRHDNPRLTVRDKRFEVEGMLRQPLRVVVASRGQVSPKARVFDDPATSLLAAGTLSDKDQESWGSRDVGLLMTGSERTDLKTLLEALAQRGCNEVLIEAGATLAGSFVESGLWDEAIIYIAPKLLGSHGRSLFELPFERMDQALPGHIVDSQMFGQDLRLVLKPT